MSASSSRKIVGKMTALHNIHAKTFEVEREDAEIKEEFIYYDDTRGCARKQIRLDGYFFRRLLKKSVGIVMCEKEDARYIEIDDDPSPHPMNLFRVDWTPQFPDTFFHVPWRGNTDKPCCLEQHDLYQVAKNNMLVEMTESVRAARQIFDELHDERVFEQMEGYVNYHHPTYVLSPIKIPDVNKNALGVTYAHAVANFFGFTVAKGIYQVEGGQRDRIVDDMRRLVLPPVFAGSIEAGADYILVDDVFTTGGTLAALRGYVHRHGGRVCVCSTLAAGVRVTQRATRYDQRQMGVALAPTVDTMRNLRENVGTEYRQLDSIFREGLRYGLQQLTEQEARFVSGQARAIRGSGSSVADVFRSKIIAARS